MKLKHLIVCLALIPAVMMGQHTITGTFTPADDHEWVLLYKVNPQGADYITKETLDSLGGFTINLDASHTKGMYKLVYNLPQEEYNFDVIYNAQEDIEFEFNSETGITYITSAENKLLSSYSKSLGMISQSIGNFFQSQSTDSTALVSIFNTLKETQHEYEKLAQGKLVETFILANRPYLPEGYEDPETYVGNIKKHYFKNVDFDNEFLQSSSFLVERVLSYVFGMSGEEGLSETAIYKANFIEAAQAIEGANLETRKMIFYIIWQQLAEANYEELANFIADNYLIAIANELNEEAMVAELQKFKELSRGMIAPDFELSYTRDGKDSVTSLNALDIAQNYILVFWSSTCAHCLEELPQLHQFMKNMNSEDFVVIAFALEDEKDRWQEVITDYPEFIHTVGLGKWENQTGNAYNVTATPSYFILDKDKKILAKPQDFETLKMMFVNE